jgi:Protein of unknown function (DUF4435)
MNKRYELKELIVRLKFKPKQLFIFVEGRSDEKILKGYLDQVGNTKDVAIRRVDLVNVTDEDLAHYGLAKSNRNKVITISRKIAEVNSKLSSMLFVIDRDLDDYIGEDLRTDILCYTDFTSMETYHFSDVSLQKLIDHVNLGVNVEASILKETVGKHLIDLFACRITHFNSPHTLSQVDRTGKFKVRSKKLTFNFNGYLIDYLKSNGVESEMKLFKQNIETTKKLFNGDVRKYVHGHDMIELLKEYYSCVSKTVVEEKTMEDYIRLLFLDISYLKQFDLFKKVKEFSNPD